MKQQGYLLDTNICAFYLRGLYDVERENTTPFGWYSM